LVSTYRKIKLTRQSRSTFAQNRKRIKVRECRENYLKGVVRWIFSRHNIITLIPGKTHPFIRAKKEAIFPKILAKTYPHSRKRSVEIFQLSVKVSPPDDTMQRIFRNFEEFSLHSSENYYVIGGRGGVTSSAFPSHFDFTDKPFPKQGKLVGCRYLGKYWSVLVPVKRNVFLGMTTTCYVGEKIHRTIPVKTREIW